MYEKRRKVKWRNNTQIQNKTHSSFVIKTIGAEVNTNSNYERYAIVRRSK